MKEVLMPILMIVLALYLILMFFNMSSNFDKVSEYIEVSAVENTATEEIIYVHQEIFMITELHIDGIHYNIDDVIIGINTIEDGSIILVNNATGIGDVIELYYLYQVPSSEFTTVFIDTVPLLMIIILIGGIAYVIYRKR